MVQCSCCDVVYEVVFQRNPEYTQIQFCPFCGEEFPADLFDKSWAVHLIQLEESE